MKDLMTYGILAFWSGVMLNFVPCVLPVIPLKIRAVLNEIKGDIRSRMLAATALLTGSVLFFLILGASTAYLGKTWSVLFQSKVFLSCLSAFFFFAAISTFADWSFRLPQFVYKFPIQRYTGAFLTGALAGILSTPCSGPFIGSVLAYTLTKPPAVILMIFSFIAFGLAAPYVLILLWPGLMDRLSFASPWTVQIKQILGFILLAGAVFFGRVLVHEAFHSFLWWMFYAAVAIWTISVFIRVQGWGGKLFPIAIMVLLSAIILTFQEGDLKWREYSPESLRLTLQEHRPALLEFTAEWCLNCKVLEKTAYANKEVIQAARKAKLVPYRIDMTDYEEHHRVLLNKFGGTVLPFALLMDKNGNVIQRFIGMFTAHTMVDAINRLQLK